MIFSKKGFLGDGASSRVLWSSGDQEGIFKANLKTQPRDWYYRNAEIVYEYNNDGHRCKDIEDIDLDNYILFAGCSHTKAVGLELEKSYPYLVADHFKLDYYNLAVGGSGIDVIEYNLLLWASIIPKKPKLVVIQWPIHNRFLSWRDGYNTMFTEGTWSNEDSTLRFIDSSETLGLFNARKKITSKLISNVYNCPIHYVQMSDAPLINLKNYVNLRIVDKARDLGHPGIESHERVANDLIAQINL